MHFAPPFTSSFTHPHHHHFLCHLQLTFLEKSIIATVNIVHALQESASLDIGTVLPTINHLRVYLRYIPPPFV